MATGDFSGDVYASGCGSQLYAASNFFKGLDFTNMVVLDCGCGNGLVTLEILKGHSPKHVYAFDASESQIEKARKAESKVEWFVATFDNFLEKKPELKGKIDIVISNFSIHFAPSLEHYFSLVASVLRPKGIFWGTWPIQKYYMGTVINAAKKQEKFSALLADFPVDVLHPNGVVIPGKKNKHHLKTTFAALKSFDRKFVSKATILQPHKNHEAVVAFVAGINPARSVIPKEMMKEFDEFCGQEMLKLDGWEGFYQPLDVMQVRTQLSDSVAHHSRM